MFQSNQWRVKWIAEGTASLGRGQTSFKGKGKPHQRTSKKNVLFHAYTYMYVSWWVVFKYAHVQIPEFCIPKSLGLTVAATGTGQGTMMSLLPIKALPKSIGVEMGIRIVNNSIQSFSRTGAIVTARPVEFRALGSGMDGNVSKRYGIHHHIQTQQVLNITKYVPCEIKPLDFRKELKAVATHGGIELISPRFCYRDGMEAMGTPIELMDLTGENGDDTNMRYGFQIYFQNPRVHTTMKCTPCEIIPADYHFDLSPVATHGGIQKYSISHISLFCRNNSGGIGENGESSDLGVGKIRRKKKGIKRSDLTQEEKKEDNRLRFERKKRQKERKRLEMGQGNAVLGMPAQAGNPSTAKVADVSGEASTPAGPIKRARSEGSSLGSPANIPPRKKQDLEGGEYRVAAFAALAVRVAKRIEGNLHCMAPAQFVALKSELVGEIRKTGRPLKFLHCIDQGGIMVIQCLDEETHTWLTGVIPTVGKSMGDFQIMGPLDKHPGTLTPKPIAKHKLRAWVPGEGPEGKTAPTVRAFLHSVSMQNGVNTNNWRWSGMEDGLPRGFRAFWSVTDSDLAILKEKRMVLHYGLEIIPITKVGPRPKPAGSGN